MKSAQHLHHVFVIKLVLVSFKKPVQNVSWGLRFVKGRLVAFFLALFDLPNDERVELADVAAKHKVAFRGKKHARRKPNSVIALFDDGQI